MRNGIIRFGALYVYTVGVLLLIGLLLPNVAVGLHALWAGVILTIGALVVKPTLTRVLRRSAAKSAAERTRVGEKVLQYALVYLVELAIWVLTVWLSAVSVSGFVWGYVIPPLLLLIGWVIYDRVDDALHAKAGELYDAVQTRRRGSATNSAAATPVSESRDTTAARRELDDGLTPEQRRLLDEL